VVIRWILLIKFIAAVLHSSASILSDPELKRKCVLGFLKLAGKILHEGEVQRIGAEIWRSDTIDRALTNPVDETMVMLIEIQNV